MKFNTIVFSTTLSLVILAANFAFGSDLDGTVKLGGVIIDDEGNPGVNQSTFNTYDGVALSLERFRYNFDNGTRLFANLKNITMNNRNLRLSVSKRGLYGASLSNSQYRRLYSQDGASFTRRRHTGGDFWVQPHEYAKLYGGYHQTEKYGDMVPLFSDIALSGTEGIDYTSKSAHGGLTLAKDRRELDVNYRITNYTDELGVQSDRSGSRFRTTVRSPLPRYDNVFVYGGYQNYRYEVEATSDTLTANTGWFGGQASLNGGYSFRGNFVWDRARRTGDLSATDNLSTAFYVGKTWVRQGGVTIGYRHYLRDDVADELSGDGYHVSGWYSPNTEFTFRAGYGTEQTDDNAGRTLVGSTERTKEYVSVRYKFRPGSQARLFLENQSRENEEIRSSVNYLRVGFDLFLADEKYGELTLAYSILDGEYEQHYGRFGFRDHVISGDVTLPSYDRVTLSGGGNYVRSLEDSDIESFSVRLSANFALTAAQSLEFTYTAHNFDDLSDISPPYTRYYTANIIELHLISGL